MRVYAPKVAQRKQIKDKIFFPLIFSAHKIILKLKNRTKKVVVCPEGKDNQRFIFTPSTSGSVTSGIFSANQVSGRGAHTICLIGCTIRVESSRLLAKKVAHPAR